MTIKDYLESKAKSHSLGLWENELQSIAEEIGEDFDFTMQTEFDPDDTHLCNLTRELCLTLEKNQFNTNERFLIMTLPLKHYTVFREPVSSSYELIVFDNNTMALCTNIAQLIAKAIPRYKTGIIPSKDDNDHKKNIAEKIASINVDDYNAFKKAILIFNGRLYNPVSLVSNTDKVTEQLRDSLLLFLMGHEFAHVLLGHDPYEDEKTLTGVKENWIERETAADCFGHELMQRTMFRIYYPNVKYEAEFNLGFEICIKCLSMGEQLSLVFMRDKDRRRRSGFSGTHPDARGSRMDRLRKKVEASINWEINEESEDTIIESKIRISSFHYIMGISTAIFDFYERKLSEEMVFLAAKLDKQCPNDKDFLKRLETELKESACGTETGFFDTEIPGLREWRAGKFTKAIGEFAKRAYKEKFYRILSALHCFEYEKHYFRMLSRIGHGEDFAKGVLCLCDKKFMEAREYLEKVYNREPNDPLVTFSLGYTYSKIGEGYFLENDFQNALQFFDLGIETSPLVKRKTFRYRSCIHKKWKNNDAASKDKTIYDILCLAPSTEELAKIFIASLPV